MPPLGFRREAVVDTLHCDETTPFRHQVGAGDAVDRVVHDTGWQSAARSSAPET